MVGWLDVEVVAGGVPHATSVARETTTRRVRIGEGGVARMVHRMLKEVYEPAGWELRSSWKIS